MALLQIGLAAFLDSQSALDNPQFLAQLIFTPARSAELIMIRADSLVDCIPNAASR
jgi:hypothetical protein